MPPKTAKSPKPAAKATMEEIQQEMCDKLTFLTTKIESMEVALTAMANEKDKLKQQVQEQAEEILELRDNLNEREQYARSWSMRALNIKVPVDEETDTRLVMTILYDSLLHPILEGARAKGEIQSVPSCEALLETAHVLPGKAGSKPVIARFYSRYWRNLVFRHRKEYAPREPAAASSSTRSSGGRGGARMRFPFFEDLTRATFAKLTSVKAHESVTSAWTVNGCIRFKIKDKETVFRINKLSDSVESVTS